MTDPQVETQIWIPEADTGYSRLDSTKTVNEVFAEIRAIVGENPAGCDEYFNVSMAGRGDAPWPDGRIIVFPVTGGSEGHYVHVEVQDVTGESQLLLLGKTFDGWDAAWAFAKRLARILGV